MGIYINPSDRSKEAFLQEYGVPVELKDIKYGDVRSAGSVPVCLMNNGPFTAAGVCYDEAEFEVFATDDGRDKRWFIIPLAALSAESGVEQRDVMRMLDQSF